MQPRPSADGDGLVHVRCRCDSPLATELLHDDQLVQVPQPPLTGKSKSRDIISKTIYCFNNTVTVMDFIPVRDINAWF